ncbi:CELR2 protein, partial [Herpetotheres cachinnans]|nr:CELR2 protein [Herpetotheres cachinnans]
LDRERAEAHRLVVEAWDGGSPRRRGRLRVSVRVLDENDNAPAFSRGEYRARLREDAPPGTAVCRLRATDPDLGANGEVRYAINRRQSDPDGYFAVEERSGVLRLRRPLDREARALHRLVVEARDGGAQPEGGLSAQAFVRIEIEDINDNQPVFEQAVYVTSISSHTQPGTEIINVVATDRDSGIYGIVTYISSGDPHGRFSIDPQFGIIRTKKHLDYETQAEYTLHIAAEDCGRPPLTSSLMLGSLAAKIVILDINDNSPSFTSSPLSYVMENVEVGFLLHRIIAKDPDEGRNGQVTYHILSGNENKAFVLDKITGLLTTAHLLDREIQERYSLTVMALDGGSPALSATQVLTIIVLDVNDETPIFLKQLYETAVRENQDPGEFVVKVEAVDRDAGLNSLLQYEILPGTGYEKFKMNLDSGELVTTASLDRETQEVFSIKGNSCRDLGSPSRSSTAQLYLTVLDENDHNPLFAKAQYQISVREDLEEGSAILDLFASDEDDGLNGEVMYSLVDDTFGAFAVNSVTGSIVTTKALDRETKSQYTFRAVASDCSTHLPRSTTVMTVLVQDVNDNVPKFEQSYYKASVWEGQSPKTDIIQVFATDLDSGLNGETEYSILSGNENGTFLIDSARGILATNTVLDHENTSSYREMASSHRLVLLASDRGMPSLNSTATVLITVLDVNDNPPVFSSPEYHIHVKESIPVGSHVTEVSANDCDAGANAEITYAIISGNERGYFHLDGKTGSLDLMKMLDYEDTMKFTLIIQAT